MCTAIRDFVRTRPVAAFFTFAFAVSWLGIAAVAVRSGFPLPANDFERWLPLGIAVMLLGPSLAGLLFIGLVHGRAGLQDFLQRLATWRLAPRWYVIALLTAPLLMLLAGLWLSVTIPGQLPGTFVTPEKSGLIILALLSGVSAGIFEELGWTGYALPMLRRRFSVLQTGLVLGFLWGGWHLIVNFWGSGDAEGNLDYALLSSALFWSVVILPAYRVLMVWVYEHTQSLLLSMVMHMGLTSSMILFNPLNSELLLPRDMIFAILLLLCATLAIRSVPRTALLPSAGKTAAPA